MSVANRVHFRMMSLIHEDLYKLFRDPYKVLNAAGLRRGQDVLEVGCGPGFFTIPAAKMVGEEGSVLALDINPLAVDKVLKKSEQAGVTNVRTILADASETGLPDESFDLIFVFGLGRAIGGVEGMMAELHRLLKPEGILSVEGPTRPASRLFRPVEGEGRIVQYRKAA